MRVGVFLTSDTTTETASVKSQLDTRFTEQKLPIKAK